MRCLLHHPSSFGVVRISRKSGRDGRRCIRGQAASSFHKGAAPLEVHVRPATRQDFWAAAEVHASAFHHKRTPLAYNIAKIARFNDIVRSSDARFLTDCLVIPDSRYVCLVAHCDPLDERTPNDEENSLMTSVLRSLYPIEFRAGIVENPCVRGIYGAMNVDTTGRFVPRLALVVNGGGTKQQPPKGCAYFSNLSVLPGVRRRGIGSSLIREAERLSTEWGCWGAALHCSCDNSSAYGLYTKQGYAEVEGAPRDKNDCVLLAKVY